VIVAVSATEPVAVPVTTPLVDTVATEVLLLLQLPEAEPSLRLVVEPWHTEATPSIDDGNGLTVTTAVVWQPVGNTKMIVEVPADSPVTTPVVPPISAMPVALLLHVPGALASVSGVVAPAHTSSVPVISAGNGLTVTTAVVIHPVGNV